MSSGEARRTVLEGMLVPTGWTAGGEVVDINLMTFDEKDLSIDSRVIKDHGLLDLIRRRVRLFATVQRGHVVGLSHVALLDDPPLASAAAPTGPSRRETVREKKPDPD